ncbi:heme ABC transporter ATP-binding protein [Aestuariibius sp. 2305UL40-4]|uniref:heme ABC transporter ATP-binding protein n=1 Tax=Aestuariibius violaceus TaxID=3234132 RepID=UPI00345F0139
MLEARDLHIRLGRKPILTDVSCTAAPGEITVIIGPNGSGKTTLLRALSGDIPYDGRVTLDGLDIATADPAFLAGIRAVLPQATPLAFPFTVHEVVSLGATAGLSGADPTLADRALAKVDLAGYGPRFYQELSGGEQQRVQLARILAQVWQPLVDGAPRWLLLDEPVSSLDLAHQILVMRLAERFAQAGGGVVIILHDLNLTGMFADQVLLMSNGTLAQSGTPDRVLTDANIGAAYGCRVRSRKTPREDSFFLLPHLI